MGKHRFKTFRPYIPPSEFAKLEKRREDLEKPALGRLQFVKQSDDVEQSVRAQTVGLVQLDQFRRIKEERQLERDQGPSSSSTGTSLNTADKPADSVDGKAKKRISKNQLSFADDDDAEDFLDMKPASKKSKNSSNIDIKQPVNLVEKTVTKDPSVDTSFLPDNAREERDRLLEEERRQKWLRRQDDIKAQEIKIPYSFWDGTKNEGTVTCKKSDPILKVVQKCKDQISNLKKYPVEELAVVMQELILPHHLFVYDLLLNKTHGPNNVMLFGKQNYDIDGNPDDFAKQFCAEGKYIVHQDTEPLTLVFRQWLARHRHVYPASIWQDYDPVKHSIISTHKNPAA